MNNIYQDMLRRNRLSRFVIPYRVYGTADHTLLFVNGLQAVHGYVAELRTAFQPD